MTFGTYLSIVNLAKEKNISNATNVDQEEILANANALLAKVATLNFSDDLIVANINEAHALLASLTS
jgi:hypothetical protein